MLPHSPEQTEDTMWQSPLHADPTLPSAVALAAGHVFFNTRRAKGWVQGIGSVASRLHLARPAAASVIATEGQLDPPAIDA